MTAIATYHATHRKLAALKSIKKFHSETTIKPTFQELVFDGRIAKFIASASTPDSIPVETRLPEVGSCCTPV